MRHICVLVLFFGLVTGFGGDALASDEPLLLRAVKDGDSVLAQALLRKGADVNGAAADGATALHWAAHRDDLSMAAALLKAGGRANAANDLGITPLFLAVQNGNAPMVELLLKGGADANHLALPNKVSPLMLAARTGNVTAVRLLLAHGANVHAKETARGQTALMWAVAQQHADVVRVLVELGSDLKARSREAAVLISTGRSEDKSAPLRQNLVETIDGGFTPLLFAARNGDTASAAVLIDAGADVNAPSPPGATPLVIAAHSGHGAMGVLLLNRGADPNANGAGYTALHAAILRGDETLVKALLSKGANPSAPLRAGTGAKRFHKEWSLNEAWVGATPLLLAAKFAEAGMMRQLVAAGANPSFIMKDGTTILMAAAGMGTPGIGLDNTGSDRHGRSLDPAEIEVALAHNEDTRDVMPSGVEAVRYVLEFSADVNARNDTGQTALHAAAFHGFESVIELLVQKGATLNLADKAGKTPLAIAVEEKRTATAELLRKLGAS